MRFFKHIMVFVALFLLLNTALNFFFNQQKEGYLNVQTQLLSSQYKTQYNYLKIMSHDIYTMYQDNSRVVNILQKAQQTLSLEERNRLREKLYNMLKKRYKRLVHMGVEQIQFHLANNVSFLRMHTPYSYGDNLTKIRDTIHYTNESLKPSEGFEVGKTLYGFRFVYPMFAQDAKHIGSMEVAFSSEMIMQYMNNKSMLDKHFIIKKTEIDTKLDKTVVEESYEDALESSRYYRAKKFTREKQPPELQKIINKIRHSQELQQKMQEGKPFATYDASNYHSVMAVFLPIQSSFQKSTVAFLIIYTESDYIDTLLLEYDYARVMLAIVLFLLLLFSIYVSVTQSKLEMMAHYDKLTTLPNRAFFYAELEIEIKRAQRKKKQLAVLFIDLDGFKRVNDTYGHDAGDELLVQVAHRLKHTIRSDDLVGRVGGDEFVVLLGEMNAQKDVILVAHKVVEAMSMPFTLSSTEVQIGASVGIALYPDHAQDADSLVKCADNAMYIAKNGGKNNFHLYDETKG